MEKSDNELIEDFNIKHGGKPNVVADIWFYGSDWSMLMPVVEKIEKVLEEYVDKNVSWLYWHNVFDGYVITKINVLHSSVIGFIKWYNTQTP